MDPITLGLGVFGLATSLFGGVKSSQISAQQAGVSRDISYQEGQQNDIRQSVMNMNARRAQIETVRNMQRARAYGIQAGATQAGSLTGSGVQGGIASSEDQGLFGLQGINNTQFSNNQMYGLNRNITSDRMQLATLGGQASTYQGVQSLGGAMMNVAPMASKFFGGGSFGNSGGFGMGSMFMGGGSPSGY